MANVPIMFSADYVAPAALAFGAVDAPATAVDADHPLPVALGTAIVAVRAAAPAVAAATIPAGDSVSAPVDLGDQRLHQVMLPAGWTAAALSFQVSASGSAWADLHDMAGEVATPTLAGARSVAVDPAVFLGVRYLRVRSGSAASPIAQTAARTITLLTVAR